MNKDAEIVAEGYNRIGAVYNEWSKTVRVAERDRYLRKIKALCPHGGKILDIGCGNGCSVASHLAKEWEVVGIDVSEDGGGSIVSLDHRSKTGFQKIGAGGSVRLAGSGRRWPRYHRGAEAGEPGPAMTARARERAGRMAPRAASPAL